MDQQLKDLTQTQPSQPAPKENGAASAGASLAPAIPPKQHELVAEWNEAGEEISSSIAIDRADGRALKSQCKEANAEPLKDHCGKPIAIVDFLATIGMPGVQADGEEADKILLILVGQDGTLYSTWSSTAIKGWAPLARALGYGPYDPPIYIRATKRKGKKPEPYITICELTKKQVEQLESVDTKKAKK